MYESVLPLVLDAYKIKYLRIYSCQKGYRNEIWPVLSDSGQIINTTFFKRESGAVERIRRANSVSEYLAERGLPTRQRIDPRILALNNNGLTTYAGVYTYLPGETIPWESYTMKHIKTLGSTLSNMHALLSKMPDINLTSVYDEYSSILKRMQNYFTNPKTQNAIIRKLGLNINPRILDKYKKLLQKYNKLPNKQPLHMDFVRGNILFEDTDISGILDFEKTASGHTIVDIARTLAFLLVDCKYKPYDKVDKYFLYSGYQKRGRSKDIGNDDDRNQFVEMFLFYDLYKFLLHNPYESLRLNEHHVRTKDILVRYGVVLLE